MGYRDGVSKGGTALMKRIVKEDSQKAIVALQHGMPVTLIREPVYARHLEISSYA